MATSKPEFQGTVLTNGGGGYCALYKRRVINTSGALATQYYWLPTNISGDITDFRVNVMNGTFADAATANANLPSGYGTYTDNWKNEKCISYMYNYPFDNGDVNAFKQAIGEWVALGANNLLIPIFWWDVFTTYSAQTTNADGSWTAVDELIEYAKDQGVKVSLMVHLYLSGRYIPDFWGATNNEKDIFGNYRYLSDYGNSLPSLAGSGADMMKDFYQKVLQRYSGNTEDYHLGSQLNWVTPVNTEQSEYGFDYENRTGYQGIDHKTLYGYSADSIAGFRYWLQTSAVNPDYYGDISALKTAWGSVASSYSSFSDVQPPTTPYSIGADEYQLTEVFLSNQGKDFWKYLAYGQLDTFAEDLRDITSTYAPQAKFVLSFGGVSPEDPLNGLRGSHDVNKWSEVSDGLKSRFNLDKRTNIHAMSLDYVQNYTGKKMMELHHIDYFENGALSKQSVKENMIAAGESGMQNGLKDLLFIGMIKHGEWYTMLKDVMEDLKPKMALNYDNTRQTGGRSATITIGEILSSPGGRIAVEKWQAAGGSNINRVQYLLESTIEPGTNDFPYSLSLSDCQTYYIRENTSKNSYYGRVAKDPNGNPVYTTLQQSYNATRVPFLLSAFGITYAGTKTRSTIEIIDNNGVVWVKSVQNVGVSSTEQSGKYSNNHPEFRYIEGITEDCRFWLPIPGSGGYYDVKITVYDAACRFDVYHADKDAPSGITYNPGKATTSAGSTETIRISLAQMGQSNIDQRVIKINNNKWA